MALTPYLGERIVNDIKIEAIERSKEFMEKNPATKLALVDQTKLELEMYKVGTRHIINALDDSEARVKELEKHIDYYKNSFCEVDKNFVERGGLEVVRTDDRIHAKRSLSRYIQK